jgi:hypothetical protein
MHFIKLEGMQISKMITQNNQLTDDRMPSSVAPPPFPSPRMLFGSQVNKQHADMDSIVSFASNLGREKSRR